jgi:predicted branched-subunit amino acid permease
VYLVSFYCGHDATLYVITYICMSANGPSSSITRNALAIGVATGAYGVSFGVLSQGAGLPLLQTMAMSLLVFTGATQFSVIATIAAGGGLATALGNGLLLAARNTAYGFAMAPLLRGSLLRRLLGSQIVIDESVAMARAQEDEGSARRALLATGVSVYVFWNAGTVAGALAGEAIGDPASFGLDAMFPAAFLALLAPQLRAPGAPRAAVAGALIAALLVPFTPPGIPVLAAALGVLAARRQ